VFLPYSREVYTATRQWTQDRKLFPEIPSSAVSYDEATLV
jgi:hypothetical protein